MNIDRICFLSPVEPHPLSFRAPSGLETQVTVSFRLRNQDSVAYYDSDLGAQMQLTARSTDRTITYPMPATDVANGKARAIIPAGDLVDPYGYRLRMVGTLNGAPTLLAVGSVMPVATAGLDIPPPDVIDTIPLTFVYNEEVELDVALWQDAGKGTPFDLTSGATTVSATIYATKGGLLLMPFTVTVVNSNTVRLTLTADQVNLLPASCWWTLVASSAAGSTTLAEGTVTVSGTVIPPLADITVDYDYQKPAAGDVNPVSGQIIHSNITQNLLKVSIYSSLAIDMTPTLSLLEPGDEITIGATTWVVGLSAFVTSWYEIKVSPVAQDAASGVTAVTFRRP